MTNFILEWDTTSRKDGEVNLTVQGIEMYGAKASVTFILEIDNSPPTITEVFHKPDFPGEESIISIYATISDTTAFTAFCNFTIDNGDSWSRIPLTQYSGDIYKVQLGTFLNGTKIQYYIFANDTLDNLGQSSIQEILMGQQPPDTNISILSSDISSSSEVSASLLIILLLSFVVISLKQRKIQK